ncbi:MAG: germination protein YpeB [Oscillospiraceae bacterium]|nr:germination protein YpeB [Oscillospiraceae bacterium]
MSVSKRTLIRIVSFTVAFALVLIIRNFQLMWENADAKNALENNYHRAIEDLSMSADNITNTLSKGIYCGTPQMMQKLSVKLWNDASNAKIALAQLPMEELQLQNTYKFLSQVGNYALSVSKKAEQGEKLTTEEYNNLKTLYDYSKDFSRSMWALENLTESGQIVITILEVNTDSEIPDITDGFKEFEEGFENYPALIYDGPFSDHILEKTPLMLEGQSEISEENARKLASKACNVNENQLQSGEPEAGKMPSYVFDADGVSVAVTKRGGFLSYMIKSREVASTSISTSKALNNAVDYLISLGISGMKVTYYETYNNVMTINFASKQDDVLCYTDLIKVSVALDNGEILGFDARGYIVNHTLRDFPDERISQKQAKSLVSPLLTIKETQLALIPTNSQGEVLCYEFLCESADGNKILVYIGVESGEEEDILILYQTENGVLTM